MAENAKRSELDWSLANMIALAAFCLSLVGLGWQIYDAVIGARPALLSPEGRVVEFRCSKKGNASCWGDAETGEPGAGRLAVILPAFFTNTGASRYNSIVTRVEAHVSLGSNASPLKLVANSFWQLAQGGSSSSKPFVPMVIEGGSANGAELRFVAFEPEGFLPWLKFAEDVSGRKYDLIRIEMKAFVADGKDPLTTQCFVHISENLADVLSERKERRATKGKYLATTCRS